MFGNTKGWIYAGVIGLLMAYGIYAMATPGSPTPPTGTLKIAMQPAMLPVDPNTVLPAPTKDCDAADLYRKAIDEYSAHEQAYEKYSQKVTEALEANPQAVQYLLQASECGTMHLFDKKPDELIGYSDRPSLDALNSVGSICNQIALLYAAKKDPERTRQYATAAFNLGRHLFDERIVFIEWSDGITLMEDAAAALARIEPDATKAEAQKNFLTEANGFRRDKIVPLWQIVSGIGESDVTKYAGDIQQMATKQNPERMWRVEALLKLGRYRYFAGTKGDQYFAKHETADLAKTETDPIVKIAADKAHSLTPDEYHMIK